MENLYTYNYNSRYNYNNNTNNTNNNNNNNNWNVQEHLGRRANLLQENYAFNNVNMEEARAEWNNWREQLEEARRQEEEEFGGNGENGMEDPTLTGQNSPRTVASNPNRRRRKSRKTRRAERKSRKNRKSRKSRSSRF